MSLLSLAKPAANRPYNKKALDLFFSIRQRLATCIDRAHPFAPEPKTRIQAVLWAFVKKIYVF